MPQARFSFANKNIQVEILLQGQIASGKCFSFENKTFKKGCFGTFYNATVYPRSNKMNFNEYHAFYRCKRDAATNYNIYMLMLYFLFGLL